MLFNSRFMLLQNTMLLKKIRFGRLIVGLTKNQNITVKTLSVFRFDKMFDVFPPTISCIHALVHCIAKYTLTVCGKNINFYGQKNKFE